MSFFGFNTKLPQDSAQGGAQGIFDRTDPFAATAQAHKLQAFSGAQQEAYDRSRRH